jgi:hypothetical protein
MDAPVHRQPPHEDDWTARNMAGLVQMLVEAPDLAYLQQHAPVMQKLRRFFEEATLPPESLNRDTRAYMRVG